MNTNAPVGQAPSTGLNYQYKFPDQSQASTSGVQAQNMQQLDQFGNPVVASNTGGANDGWTATGLGNQNQGFYSTATTFPPADSKPVVTSTLPTNTADVIPAFDQNVAVVQGNDLAAVGTANNTNPSSALDYQLPTAVDATGGLPAFTTTVTDPNASVVGATPVYTSSAPVVDPSTTAASGINPTAGLASPLPAGVGTQLNAYA